MRSKVHYKLVGQEVEVVEKFLRDLRNTPGIGMIDLNLVAKRALFITIQQAYKEKDSTNGPYDPVPGISAGNNQEMQAVQSAPSDALPDQADASGSDSTGSREV